MSVVMANDLGIGGMPVRSRKITGLMVLAALLSSCGGGGGGGGGSTVAGSGPSATPTPTPVATTTAGCALGARQDWLRAQVDEWYLFPDTVPAQLDKTQYATLTDYLDALTAVARAQRKDRYFSYVTSASDETAFDTSGATGGLGLRLDFDSQNRLVVQEAFEGAPALTAGIDRGTQILAVGPSTARLQTITDMIARRQYDALDAAFGDSAPGTPVVLRIATDNGSRDVTLAKAEFNLAALSSRYGYKVITEGERKIGYLNLRVFITAADDGLRNAFALFKKQGVTDMIVDLRYNGGGALSTAVTLTNLLGGARSASDVQSYIAFRPSKAANNETINFEAEAAAIAPGKIAFIGTGDTASASEYVMNAMLSYLRGNTVLIGANTYGKPVGQIGLDNPACPDDRLRLIALQLENASHRGNYYNGLWSEFDRRCSAADDLTHPLGDPQESSTRAALDFIEGRPCASSGSVYYAQAPKASGRGDGLRPRLPNATGWSETPRIF